METTRSFAYSGLARSSRLVGSGIDFFLNQAWSVLTQTSPWSIGLRPPMTYRLPDSGSLDDVYESMTPSLSARPAE